MAQSGVKVPESVRNAIVAGRLAGLSVTHLAKRYEVHPATVHRLCKTLRQAAQETIQDWRTEQITLAVTSVNRALRDPKDVYKSAAIGVQALKGHGVYQPDTSVQFNIAQRLDQLPSAAQQLLETTTEECESEP